MRSGFRDCTAPATGSSSRGAIFSACNGYREAEVPQEGLMLALIALAALPARALSQDSLSSSAVTAGATHTCALSTTERVHCWGDNSEGELGSGTRLDSPSPIAVAGDLRFLDVDAGVQFTCGVTTSGEAYCWGRNTTGALGNAATPRSAKPVPVTGGILFRSVKAGGDHACGVDADGI